jgi:hypothetical protein
MCGIAEAGSQVKKASVLHLAAVCLKFRVMGSTPGMTIIAESIW